MTRQKRIDSIDNIVWKCNKCRSEKSIRANTFFSKSKLSMAKIIEVIYFWCMDYTVKQACHELEVDKNTIIDWYRFCRDLVYAYFNSVQISEEKIGGPGRIIEIDESVFSKRKYHRGRVVKETWVFGGIDRDNPQDLFVEIVPDRSQETLLEVNFLKPNPNLTLT